MQFSQSPSAAPLYFPESHWRSEISSLSKVILVLGKARSRRVTNLGYNKAESPGWFDVSPKISAWDMMHEWAAKAWMLVVMSPAPLLHPNPISSGQDPQIPLTVCERWDPRGPPRKHPTVLEKPEVYFVLSFSHWIKHGPQSPSWCCAVLVWGKGDAGRVAVPLTPVKQCFSVHVVWRRFCLTPWSWIFTVLSCLWVVSCSSSCERDWS